MAPTEKLARIVSRAYQRAIVSPPFTPRFAVFETFIASLEEAGADFSGIALTIEDDDEDFGM